MTQEMVNDFGRVGGSDGPIHTDPEVARPLFVGTVAHGYLTLSLVAAFMQELLRIEGARVRINYGLDKVRFPAAVRAGSRVRARPTVRDVEELPDAMVQAAYTVTVEADRGGRPVCVAETLARYAR